MDEVDDTETLADWNDENLDFEESISDDELSSCDTLTPSKSNETETSHEIKKKVVIKFNSKKTNKINPAIFPTSDTFQEEDILDVHDNEENNDLVKGSSFKQRSISADKSDDGETLCFSYDKVDVFSELVSISFGNFYI